MFDQLMNGGVVGETVVLTEPVQVIVRSSTDTIDSDDPEVIKAMQFIWNITNLITAEYVVKVTNMCRRVLYRRFKQITVNTINEEIQLDKLKKFKE
jgi:LacI family transcriptional regulator